LYASNQELVRENKELANTTKQVLIDEQTRAGIVEARLQDTILQLEQKRAADERKYEIKLSFDAREKARVHLKVQAAAAERLEQERAMAAAKKARDICIEGKQQDWALQRNFHGRHFMLPHRKMAKYELVEGKEVNVNGRGVWQMAGQEFFMYYTSSKEWWISDRASMEAGKAAGWMHVKSTALTPNQIIETWQVYDGTWSDAPEVRVRVLHDHERQQQHCEHDDSIDYEERELRMRMEALY
jgi:hypothetical protein